MAWQLFRRSGCQISSQSFLSNSGFSHPSLSFKLLFQQRYDPIYRLFPLHLVSSFRTIIFRVIELPAVSTRWSILLSFGIKKNRHCIKAFEIDVC